MQTQPTPLIEPADLDRRLVFPRGRSARLARKGLIPHVKLPDGEIRFDPIAIDRWLLDCAEGITAATKDGKR